MEILNNLITVFITIGTVAGTMITLSQWNSKFNPLTKLSNFIKTFSEDMASLKATTAENNQKINDKVDSMQLEILGMKVYIKDLPVEMRYVAAKEYLAKNGNHGTDIYCKTLIKEYGEKIERTEEIL